jgi:Family of unknown function (DUF6879)
VSEDPGESSFETLLGGCTTSAVHLEMRDYYTPTDPVYLDWRAGVSIDPKERWGEWYDLMSATTARGIKVRRSRIVSEPVTAFIRYEYDLTDGLNLAAGEEVRWLPRRQASDLALPGNDFWIFDNRLVRFNYFAGNGDEVGDELTRDEAVVRLCATAFESVWQRAIPHQDYRIS